MNRNSIKTFAIWARRHLREQVTARANLYGISSKELIEPQTVAGGLLVAGQTLDAEEAKQYELLCLHLKELMPKSTLREAVETLIDEIAYTWFNRLIALRYMEVNGYIGRVLSSSESMFVDPDILREVSDIAELEKLPGLNLEVLSQWRNLASREPNPDEFLYRRLLLCQCEALAESLPFLFDRSKNYMGLFLPGNLLNQDSILRRLVNDISEPDWQAKRPDEEDQQDVEIIGWLYQFYISEKKDEVIGAKTQVKALDIPAATQLFTPHWIVRYLVENSLGRLWLESHPESNLRDYMPYYLENEPPLTPPYQRGEQEQEVSSNSPLTQENLSNSPLSKGGWGGSPLQPQDLTVCDPACGSGHILVYGFTLLFLIYKEQGYLERDIPELILTHNLYGLDIDERAAQLASFAVLMKARAINSRIFRKSILLNITVVRPMNSQMIPQVKELNLQDWYPLIEAFKDADNLGSLITPPQFNRDLLQQQLDLFEQHNPLLVGTIPGLKQLLFQADLLSKKYWVVVTNPPYMGSKSFNGTVKEFVVKHYPKSKSDLFAAFLERCLSFTAQKGLMATINQQSWMFLSSYEDLRKKLLNSYTINSMIHLGARAFPEIGGEVVQSTAFVIYNEILNNKTGVYVRLVDYPDSRIKEKKYLSGQNRFYGVKQDDFCKIPGSVIAYWVNIKFLQIFETTPSLKPLTISDGQNKTGNNDKFLRLFWEVDNQKVLHNDLYKFYAKGGDFRKWYGNLEYLVDWSIEARNHYKKDKISRIIPEYLWSKAGITWTLITSILQSFRLLPGGATFDVTGSSIFLKNDNDIYRVMSFLNSCVAKELLKISNPTLACQVINIQTIPYIDNKNDLFDSSIPLSLLRISRQDWDNFETSWDFQTHPLLRYKTPKLSEAFKNWQTDSENAFQELKQLEEENNKYWIEAYGLQDELTPEVPDNQITIRRADPNRDICSLISYAIGSLMGRYSLDKPGLIHAGQPFDSTQHTIFAADIDAIIPITDQAYFEDDIVNRFIEFISIAYSPQTLTENLDFIADTLTRKSGETSRDRIRRYFLTEFISNHIQTYKKRPIYWLFTSGKNRAFNALVYLHRYSPDTLARLRTDYVLQLQVKLDGEISRTQNEFENGTTSAAKKAATKRLKQLQTQQLELRDYQALLQTKADARIQLDLDDGVAYNYTRFKGLVYESSDLKMADLEKAAKWKLELLKLNG
ncbi:BREX-1 system adenine-specific DNA-methyltransferase PglX [Planktothrix agardhii]|uniref:BREX-1 system adenine-specific DNA-methyltransferase PglX n=1 Tax=Planktothrix agardhii TaxID=1160 RepID=UPI0020A80BD7|nr:BREX-1 system adenine-specific DNA-methyltransferase PglX [Planktothrix agardhii]CAD5984027.1 Restriction endonuclease [Planktothrix agardhii]